LYETVNSIPLLSIMMLGICYYCLLFGKQGQNNYPSYFEHTFDSSAITLLYIDSLKNMRVVPESTNTEVN